MRINASRAAVAAVMAAAALVMLVTGESVAASGSQALDVTQLVQVALEVNPQVRAARARWEAAEHSIKQAYAPNDPQISYTNGDSAGNGFNRTSYHTLLVTEAFQFPGKAILQGREVRRSADIARLTYQATVRDTRAAVEAAYYQLVLDSALAGVNSDNVRNLEQVLKVTQVAYSTNQVTQTDFISAEFDVAAARQAQLQYETNIANDETLLNQLLSRPPGAPLEYERGLRFDALKISLDTLVDRALALRQEILEAALNERNSDTALQLAKMEYLPDFTVSYFFDHYLLASAAPAPNRTEDHSWVIGANMPIFFWLKQNEDVARARESLEASRYDLVSVKDQTAATVTSLYRSAQYGYQTAILYRQSLIPLAGEDFQVALTAYQSGKIPFVELVAALRRGYDARVNYLQSANQFVANRVALEQAIGAPLGQ
ncbi:MAG TPA: TolC family protein [Candidatus Binataceae bacterium]|nr:TolC family protein [Candidatus Binataceae bacterium]